MQNSVPSPAAPSSPGTRWGIVIGVFAVIVLVGGVAAYVADLFPFEAAPEMTPEPSASANAVSATPLPAGVKTYRSEALGISFEYLAAQGEPVIEEGGVVYVGGRDGQSVEVFTKKADESLEQSIRRQILANYPSSLCTIDVVPSNIMSGYQTAGIGYPESTGGDEPWFENSKLCNPDYARTNGIRYFLYTPEYPEKFFFFSIGQYAILAEPAGDGGGKTWQDTFEVFK